MEVRKKLKMPSGNVHDIKYLYSIINSLKYKGGSIESSAKTLEYFKKGLNEYNEAKAAKYGLSFKPRGVNTEIVKHLLAELKNLNLIHKEKGYIMLTNEGEKIASLIENKKAEELKEVFTKLMLQTFTVFEYFLKRIKEISNGNGIPIPFITSDVFNKCDGDSKKIGESYVKLIKNCSNLVINLSKLNEILEREKVDLIEKRTDRINKLQSIIEKFVVSEAFYPDIQSRRTYDFVRSRTTSLGLTNYANFNFDGFPAEVVYLISDFERNTFKYSTKEIDYQEGKIYLHSPKLEDIKEALKQTMSKFYNSNKDEFGYMKISDMRDLVCRELRISDNLFDNYVKKLYQEEPHWLSFTYAGASEKITEKSLPIIFEKPMREFFTLMKLNLRR
ncbi:MAG: hypothetical protein ACUVQP_08760 [Bacteroidales bacterium]